MKQQRCFGKRPPDEQDVQEAFRVPSQQQRLH